MRVKRYFIYVLLFNSILITFLVNLASCEVLFAQYQVETKWPGGFEGSVTIPATKKFLYGWIFYILFDFSIENFQFHEGYVAGSNLTGRLYVVLPQHHNKFLDIVALGTRKMRFQAVLEDDVAPDAQALFIALKDEYETVHEGLMRATGGVINDTILTLPKTTTTVAPTTVPGYASEFSTVRRPWWMKTSATTTTSSYLRPGHITPVTPTKSTLPNLASLNFVYNLREVITLSLKFFEAQRSGYLPSNQGRNDGISWRSHSAIRDGFDYGVDLVGGYYIDGGLVKYGYPMAFSTTLLAWSFIEFETAYKASKQYPELLNAVIWSADYFVKCHVSTYELFGQVSAEVIENNYWSRPEDIGHRRPSFKITKSKPGSDLAAETSAALTTAYLITKNAKPELAREYLRHAKQLYEFAERYHRKYHLSIPRAHDYRSTGYYDELAWAAAWLYKATGEEKYLENADTRLALSNRNGEVLRKFDWNDKRVGVNILLAQFTNKQKYLDTLTEFCLYMQPGGGARYTPKGLLYLDADSPIMHASNVAFSCLLVGNLGVLSRNFQLFAHRQLSYILGDGGRSYVVGFGKNFPNRPQHRGSSCPRPPAVCDWNAAESDEANPQMLYGAVVAGPDRWDQFNAGERMDKNNQVNILYNAGLQALAAGILQLEVTGETYSEPNMDELRKAISLSFSIRHDLNEVLHKSLLFYEAQRSGTLPQSNRIAWRSSAFENDVGASGEDLSGGYFDGGGYVKFNFPMAFTTTVLSWGLIEYGEAYQAAGELDAAIDAVRWATDYFIKCHVSDTQFEVYGQVGEAKVDNLNWTRPDPHVHRRAFKLDQNKPGSEVAAEMAAALASTSLVFRKHNRSSSYADTLVAHAVQLYRFADNYKEEYHRSIPDAAPYYRSKSGYGDELVWAAVWLFMATGEERYIKNIAEPLYDSYDLENRGTSAGFYYDEKTAGVQLLLAQITGKEKYRYSVTKFCDQFMPEYDESKYTPLGLLYINNRSPLKHAAGVAHICIGAATLGGVRADKYRHFAQTQIRYILGDSGRGSYMVGYGPSYPKRPHHRLSSCQLEPASCSFDDLKSPNTNPNVLVGAVVAGPDHEDYFSDVRVETRYNRVALDQNACFQSTVAALRYLELYPPPKTTQAATTTTKATTPQPTTTATSAATTTAFNIDANILLELDNIIGALTTTTTQATGQTEQQAINETMTTKQGTTLANIVSTTPFSTTTTTTHSFVTHTTQNATDVPITTDVTMEMSGDAVMTTGVMVNTSSDATNTTLMNNLTYTTQTVTAARETATTLFPAIKHTSCNSKAVFDACSISPEKFLHHPLRIGHSCRYMAFKECVGKLKKRCGDARVKWSNFAFWNNDLQSNAWFSQEDIDCVDEATRAINECLTRGMMSTFGNCLKSTNSTSPPNCKWKSYESCVDNTLGHCVKTWSLWELWTLQDQNRTVYFEHIKEEGCTSNAISSALHSFSTLFACFFLLFLSYVF